MKTVIVTIGLVVLICTSNNAAGQNYSLLTKDNPDTLTVYYRQALKCGETSFEYVVDDEMLRARLKRRTDGDEYVPDDYPSLEMVVDCHAYTLGKTREFTVYNVYGIWAVGKIAKPNVFGAESFKDHIVWAAPYDGKIFSEPPSLGLTETPVSHIPAVISKVLSHTLTNYLKANALKASQAR